MAAWSIANPASKLHSLSAHPLLLLRPAFATAALSWWASFLSVCHRGFVDAAPAGPYDRLLSPPLLPLSPPSLSLISASTKRVSFSLNSQANNFLKEGLLT